MADCVFNGNQLHVVVVIVVIVVNVFIDGVCCTFTANNLADLLWG